MIDKVFNLFDECASRCVHLSPQEEGCTSSSWGDSKMFTSGSVVNSQRMLTEINEGGHNLATISVESGTVKYLKAFRVISSEMPISLLILSWYFSCLYAYSDIFLFSYELKMFFQIFVSKVYRVSCLEK